MTNAAQKTPISLLQELCAQFGMTPDYKLMSVEGAVHAPTFMYRVQVNDVVATATGQSKKKAKHAAAKAVLEKLLSEEGEYNKGFVSDGVTVNSETLNEIIAEPALAPTVDENVAGNPVGALQELCMKYRWQPPYYETDRATGLPHEKIFYIACYVDKFSEIGEGKSKRLAKRQAADNMLKRLKTLKIVNDDDDEVEEDAAKDAKSEDEDEMPVASNSPILENCCHNADELGRGDGAELLSVGKTVSSDISIGRQCCDQNSEEDGSAEVSNLESLKIHYCAAIEMKDKEAASKICDSALHHGISLDSNEKFSTYVTDIQNPSNC